MPIRITRIQPPSYYFAKFHIPILSESAATLYSLLEKRRYLAKKHATPSLFTSVEIETYNRCNNDCGFCPANRHDDIRTPAFLEDHIFSRIISELKELKYSGTVSLFHNNEPLLDRRLSRFVAETREALPMAHISIWTNGILLDSTMLRELFDSGLRGKASLVIDDYSRDLTLNDRTRELISAIRGSEVERNLDIVVVLRYKNAVLTNRAGKAPNKKSHVAGLETDIIRRRWCGFPFRQLNINAHGQVHICCNDVYYGNIVGDLHMESIMDVWTGEKMAHIKEELVEHGRCNLVPCRSCDTSPGLLWL